MIASRFGAQGLAVIFTILLARRLGSAGFGEYAFIAGIIFVANALTTFGTDMLLIREIAAQDDLSRLPAALILQLALSAISIAFIWLFGAWIPNQSPESLRALQIYSFALIPFAFFTVFTTALRGRQFMIAYALLNIVISALQIVAVLILRRNDIVHLAALLVLVQTVVAVIAGFVCGTMVPNFFSVFRSLSFDFSSFIKACLPIAMLALLTMLYQRLSVTLLSLIVDSTQTGIFSAAARMVEASKTAHLAIFAVLYPAMASAVSLRGGLNSHRAAYGFPTKQSPTLYFGYLLAGAILIAFLLFILAKPLVILLYGSGFASSGTVLKILSWTLVPFTINTYFILSFLASNRESLVARALTVSLPGLLILNLWWIPSQGAQGSAWATLVAECVQSVILLKSASSRISLKGEVHELSELS